MTKIIIPIIIVIFCIIELIGMDIPCLFKLIFNIPCPGCGMTRAFRQILKFNFRKAMYYNILSVPLLIIGISFIILLIKDLIKKENTVEKFIKDMDKKYYIIILLLLLILSEIINIYHGI